jgi:hypothetical protein
MDGDAQAPDLCRNLFAASKALMSIHKIWYRRPLKSRARAGSSIVQGASSRRSFRTARAQCFTSEFSPFYIISDLGQLLRFLLPWSLIG